MGTGNILRQIAIKLNGGCSFGRTKSYQQILKAILLVLLLMIFFLHGARINQKELQKQRIALIILS